MSNIRYMDDLYYIHEYGLDYKANQIYLLGEETYANSDMDEPGVEYIMASRFIKNLNILQNKSNDPILIHMKTCGGFWEEGMAIYDAIKKCENYITILNYTHARSMSSLIFLAADYRVMMEHSTYMFHQGTFATHGTVKQTLTEMELLKKDNNTMVEIYVNHLKNCENGSMRHWSKKRIREWVNDEMNAKEDVHHSAREAVKLGFADEIFDGNMKRLRRFDV